MWRARGGSCWAAVAETLVELAREWLAFAEGDLAIAQAGALATAVPGWAVALHCQQAVEKSAKGALVLQSIEPPFSHNLALLAQLLASAGVTFPFAAVDLNRLSPFAINEKYPALRRRPISQDEAQAFLPLAQAAIAWLAEQIAAAERRGESAVD